MSKGEEKIYIGCSNFTFSKAHTHSLETSWFHEQISPFMGKYWHDTTLKTQAFRVERRKKNMTLESWCSPPSAAIRKILRVSAGSDSINRVIKAKVEGFSFSTTKKNPHQIISFLLLVLLMNFCWVSKIQKSLPNIWWVSLTSFLEKPHL